MSLTLANHNPDIRRLLEKGYAVSEDSNFLVVRRIPYLGPHCELRWGAIVTKLVFVDQHTVTQQNHQVSFAGGVPHGLDGNPIPLLGNQPHSIPLSEASKDVVVERQFSNKPLNGYADFFEKIETYVRIIAGPAMHLHGVSPYCFEHFGDAPQNSPFTFRDTLTTRAEIQDLSRKFENEVIAIIGLGGSGAYLLDFMVKTPVKEIRCFDPDTFHVHTSYRSPGQLQEAQFKQLKVTVYEERYRNFRHGLTFKPEFIDEGSDNLFEGVTFAFVCVDKGTSRSGIFSLLSRLRIPFIDVGMGLHRNSGAIGGTVRTSILPVENFEHARRQCSAPDHDPAADVYKTNIQIAELNALNACIAVIAYKQIMGFYAGHRSLIELQFMLEGVKLMSLSDEI